MEVQGAQTTVKQLCIARAMLHGSYSPQDTIGERELAQSPASADSCLVAARAGQDSLGSHSAELAPCLQKISTAGCLLF